MTPQTLYLLELAKLIGRLGYALESGDLPAYRGILRNIKDLTDTSLRAHTPPLPFTVIDDVLFDTGDDDEL
jgi:hypothetical protein